MIKSQRRTRAVTGTAPVTIQRGLAVIGQSQKARGQFVSPIAPAVSAALDAYVPATYCAAGAASEALRSITMPRGLEINGVNGSLENWREILLPLLRVAEPQKEKR